MNRKNLLGLSLGILMLLTVASGVHASSASFGINSANFYGNPYSTPQSVGYLFTPQCDIIVTSLGFFDFSGDGLGESHEVGIFDSAGDLLSSTVVLSGTSSQLFESFRYTEIAPLILLGGQNYTIAALLSTNADFLGYADIADIQANPAVGFGSVPARYKLPSDGLEFPTTSAGVSGEMYYGPNFRLAPVPIPGAVWLLGSGLLGLIGLKRKFLG